MSLESALLETNELLRQLLTAVQSGQQAQSALGEPEVAAQPAKRGPGRPKKNAEASTSEPTAPPPGTRVVVTPTGQEINIPSYGATPPGWSDGPVPSACAAPEAVPTTPQAVPVPLVPAGIPPAAAPAPTAPAASAPAAVSPSSPAPAAAPVAFDAVVQLFMEINKSTAAGHGREGVMGLLTKYLPNDPKPSVPKLQALGRNADIYSDASALLGAKPVPAPTAEYDPLV